MSRAVLDRRPGWRWRRATDLPGEMAGTEAVVADPGGRAAEIDAIRGWAALSVVCFHVFWETFGVAVPWLRNPDTAALLAGRFDVVLFFILSGDALSFPFFHGGGVRYLQRAALKRYPRLTVPIVVVTAVTALAMAAGLTATGPAGTIVGQPDWLGSFLRFKASGATALGFAFYHVYEGGYRATYLPFLWTMPIELSGSFALLLVLFVHHRVRGAHWIIAGLAWVLLDAGAYTGCFLIGLLLGQARARGLYARLPRAFGRHIAPIGIVVAMVLAGRQQSANDPTLRGLAAIGTLLLLSVYASLGIVGFLARNRFSQFLGRISYLLYLWHFTVLATLTSHLILLAAHGSGTVPTCTAIGIGILTVLTSVAVAALTLPIEGWARSVNALLLAAVWRDGDPAERSAQR